MLPTRNQVQIEHSYHPALNNETSNFNNNVFPSFKYSRLWCWTQFWSNQNTSMGHGSNRSKCSSTDDRCSAPSFLDPHRCVNEYLYWQWAQQISANVAIAYSNYLKREKTSIFEPLHRGHVAGGSGNQRAHLFLHDDPALCPLKYFRNPQWIRWTVKKEVRVFRIRRANFKIG